jgi:hypothetical protein
MSARKYSEPLRACAAEIAEEVVFTGRSTGWSGTLEQCEEVQDILRPFNIAYVDDMLGEYAARPPKP